MEDNLAEGFTVFDFPLEHRLNPHHQQPGTGQRGDPQTHPRGRCLPQSCFFTQVGFRPLYGNQ